MKQLKIYLTESENSNFSDFLKDSVASLLSVNRELTDFEMERVLLLSYLIHELK